MSKPGVNAMVSSSTACGALKVKLTVRSSTLVITAGSPAVTSHCGKLGDSVLLLATAL
jgi:hypothetical protein